jgi:hypothetical protein
LVPHRNKLLCGMEGRLQLLTFLKKLFYFEWSPPWHFKAYILTCILSMIIQIRHLTREAQHRMLWFESKQMRHKKWLAFLCLCPAARRERCRKVRHAVVEVRQCLLRSGACGWVPAVPIEIWNSQLKQGWRRRPRRRWAGQLWQNLETRTWQVAGCCRWGKIYFIPEEKNTTLHFVQEYCAPSWTFGNAYYTSSCIWNASFVGVFHIVYRGTVSSKGTLRRLERK